MKLRCVDTHALRDKGTLAAEQKGWGERGEGAEGGKRRYVHGRNSRRARRGVSPRKRGEGVLHILGFVTHRTVMRRCKMQQVRGAGAREHELYFVKR